MTQYGPSMIVTDAAHAVDASGRQLAEGFPLGKRFKSVEVVRVCDGNPVHLGHHARADGRWRLYAFADAPAAGEASVLADWAAFMASPESPVIRFTPEGADIDAVFDVKVVYQQRHEDVDLTRVPEFFLPKTGPLGLTDWEKVYAAAPSAWTTDDIFEERGLSRDGVVVVVRPDQYVAGIFPLDATDELSAFFAQAFLPQRQPAILAG